MAKCAVLVGCNYPGTESQLSGCINDVVRMRSYLVERFGFPEENINLLIDTDEAFPQPTGANIRQALADMVASAEPGGYLYFHFSGHGTRVPPEDDLDDETGYDECICPSDMNLIHDDEFKEFVSQLPESCRLTVVSDSCHSGGLIDKAKEQIGESTVFHEDPDAPPPENYNQQEQSETVEGEPAEPEESLAEEPNEEEQAELVEEEITGAARDVKNRAISLFEVVQILRKKIGSEDAEAGNIRKSLHDVFGEEASPVFSGGKQESGCVGGEGILISGCQSFQVSQDIGGEEPHGVLSSTILEILEETGGEVSNCDLVLRLRQKIAEQGQRQRPGLYCSDEYLDANFICPL